MRGATAKTKLVMRMTPVCFASSIKAFNPGEGLSFTFCTPKNAKILFSSVMGTISAAIAVATKSKYCK